MDNTVISTEEMIEKSVDECIKSLSGLHPTEQAMAVSKIRQVLTASRATRIEELKLQIAQQEAEIENISKGSEVIFEKL